MIIKFVKKYFLLLLLVPHVSGIIGMMFERSRTLFMSLTPVMLILTFVVVFIEEYNWTKRNVFSILFIFISGYLAEFTGVNYGILFGDYTYGTLLGPKLFGVPLTIAMNWAMLCIAIRSLVNRYTNNVFFSAVLAALIITGYDMVLEPVAIKFDWWWWKGFSVPLFNYVCWFILTFLFQLLFKNVPRDTGKSFSILFIHIVFYLLLLIL